MISSGGPVVHKGSDKASDAQRQSNRRLALVLASVALVFFVGFVGKIVLFGR